MGMTNNNLCDSCINIGCEFQSGIVRTKCAFYMPPTVNAVPMETIDKMIAEIDNLQFIHTELEYNGAVKKVISKDDVLEIINKYCKGAT